MAYPFLSMKGELQSDINTWINDIYSIPELNDILLKHINYIIIIIVFCHSFVIVSFFKNIEE